jgi:hypothetical protein
MLGFVVFLLSLTFNPQFTAPTGTLQGSNLQVQGKSVSVQNLQVSKPVPQPELHVAAPVAQPRLEVR